MSSIPPNGITPEVIREAMPPYHLSQDLLAATLTTLPPPPPAATQHWRETRLTRLFQEIAALKPADAIQARMAAQLLTTRELADACVARAHAAPEITHLCRLARTAAELMRSAATLDRTLARHQQMPVPFYGTVIHDEVDIPALAAAWAGGRPSIARPATPSGNADASSPAKPPGAKPSATPTDAADADASPGPAATPRPPTISRETIPSTGIPIAARSVTPATADSDAPTGLVAAPTTPVAPPPVTPQPAAPQPAAALQPAVAAQPTAAPQPAAAAPNPASPPPEPTSPSPPRAPHHQPEAASPDQPPARPRTRPAGPNWVYELLDQGPGWSREVLRPRTDADPAPEPAR